MIMQQIDIDRYTVDLTSCFTPPKPFIAFGRQNVTIHFGPALLVLPPDKAKGFFELVADSVKTIDLLIEDRKIGLLSEDKYVIREYALGPMNEDKIRVIYSVYADYNSCDFLDIRGGPISISMFENKERHDFANALGYAVGYMEGCQDVPDTD